MNLLSVTHTEDAKLEVTNDTTVVETTQYKESGKYLKRVLTCM